MDRSPCSKQPRCGHGGATPLGDSCSHAPLPAVTTKSPCTNNYLAPGSACPERVNIRSRQTGGAKAPRSARFYDALTALIPPKVLVSARQQCAADRIGRAHV